MYHQDVRPVLFVRRLGLGPMGAGVERLGGGLEFGSVRFDGLGFGHVELVVIRFQLGSHGVPAGDVVVVVDVLEVLCVLGDILFVHVLILHVHAVRFVEFRPVDARIHDAGLGNGRARADAVVVGHGTARPALRASDEVFAVAVVEILKVCVGERLRVRARGGGSIVVIIRGRGAGREEEGRRCHQHEAGQHEGRKSQFFRFLVFSHKTPFRRD